MLVRKLLKSCVHVFKLIQLVLWLIALIGCLHYFVDGFVYLSFVLRNSAYWFF